MSAHVPGQAGWTRSAQRFGRYGIWILPTFALLTGLTRRSGAAFSADPVVYARYLSVGRYRPMEMATTIGLGILGPLSIVALGALLIRGRGRRFAIVGMSAALAGSTALFVVVGSVIVRAEQIRAPLLRRRLDEVAVTANATGTIAAIITLSGIALLIVGWFLFGIAVIRAPGAGRGDGVLLMVSAPLLYAGGPVSRVIPTMGSFLLLAAGLGIALAAGRMTAGENASPPANTRRSAVLDRFVDDAADLDRADPRRGRGASTARSTRCGATDGVVAQRGDPALSRPYLAAGIKSVNGHNGGPGGRVRKPPRFSAGEPGDRTGGPTEPPAAGPNSARD